MAAAAGRDAPAGGEASARAQFSKLNEAERAQLREALPLYFGVLKKEPWRAPQGISSFLHKGWRDFVPSAADKAKEAEKTLHNQIRCVAMDINNSQHKLAVKWWAKPEDVPPDIHEKAVAYAAQNFDYKPQAA